MKYWIFAALTLAVVGCSAPDATKQTQTANTSEFTYPKGNWVVFYMPDSSETGHEEADSLVVSGMGKALQSFTVFAATAGRKLEQFKVPFRFTSLSNLPLGLTPEKLSVDDNGPCGMIIGKDSSIVKVVPGILSAEEYLNEIALSGTLKLK